MNLFKNTFKSSRENLDFFLSGQKGTGVSSLESAISGIKPDKNQLKTNGVESFSFKEDFYGCVSNLFCEW